MGQNVLLDLFSLVSFDLVVVRLGGQGTNPHLLQASFEPTVVCQKEAKSCAW